jgi:hypothetical protein
MLAVTDDLLRKEEFSTEVACAVDAGCQLVPVAGCLICRVASQILSNQVHGIVDSPNHMSNIRDIFISLGDIVTENDFLFVWWMGHADTVTFQGHLTLYIENAPSPFQFVPDFLFRMWVNHVDHYQIRTFSFMTCFSGGIIDDLEGDRTIILTSSTFYTTSASDVLCDNWHAELNYCEACAFHWETPCYWCGSVCADYNENGRTSFEETYIYSDSSMLFSEPQMSDLGGLTPNTYLGQRGVVYHHHAIDDDSLGTSSGDGDGVVDPGESIEMPLTVLNGADETIYNVEAILRVDDPLGVVTITDSIEYYGNIEAFTTASSPDDYDLTVAASCPEGYVIRCELIARDIYNTIWTSCFYLPVGTQGYFERCAHMYLYWMWGDYPTNYTEEYTYAVHDGEGAPLPLYPPADILWFLMDMKGATYITPGGGRPQIYYYGLIIGYNTICDSVFAIRIPSDWHGNYGLAHDERGSPWLGSFWYTVADEDSLFHIDAVGNGLGSYNIGHHDITGLAFDRDNNHLWCIASGAPDMFLEYDVNADPILIQSMPVPWDSPSDHSASGLEYDETFDVLTAVNKNNRTTECFCDVDPSGAGGVNWQKVQTLYDGYPPTPWGIAKVERLERVYIADNTPAGFFPLDVYEYPCDSCWVTPYPPSNVTVHYYDSDGVIDSVAIRWVDTGSSYYFIYRSTTDPYNGFTQVGTVSAGIEFYGDPIGPNMKAFYYVTASNSP